MGCDGRRSGRPAKKSSLRAGEGECARKTEMKIITGVRMLKHLPHKKI